MQSAIGSNNVHGIAYAVASNPDEAYRLVRASLDARDIGFSHERTLSRIELIAQEGEYPQCGTAMYIA